MDSSCSLAKLNINSYNKFMFINIQLQQMHKLKKQKKEQINAKRK